MYSKEDRELALMALSEGWTQAEAAGLVGCARTTVGHWAAGHASRKEPAYLPYDGKRGLAARLPAGERAEDLASEGGVSAAAVRGWARRLAEEGELALMSDEDARVRSPEPAGPPAELEALRRRCEECVPSSKNRQIRLSNFDTLMLTASGRAGAVAAGPPAA